MRAGEAAKAAGVTGKALRYYEYLGLLRPARRSNGYRDYSTEDVRLAAEIRNLVTFGLTARETRPFLDCLQVGHEVGDECPESLAAYQQKIDQLDKLINRLMWNREQLAHRMRLAAERGFRSDNPTWEVIDVLPQPDELPDNLPAPVDDGAARHLPGRVLPALAFRSTDGIEVRPDMVSTARWVLFVYPLTGKPGVDMPRGWDEIPGARGCSQEACNFRDNVAALRAQGAEQVLALSTDKTEYQQDLVRRLHLPYPMLSDPTLALARALDLPMFEAGGMTLYKRLTLILQGNRIEHVFYPVFPPNTHAEEVLKWLRKNPSPAR